MECGKVAVYLRLSSSDEETGAVKKESDSIASQRLLINEYLNAHGELRTYERVEFLDDGYSGVNSDRPQLSAMMSHVLSGEVGVICVKDFSRFFRNYVEAGRYIEREFPLLGIRFISINDGYDSKDYRGVTGGSEMVLRNIVHTAYIRDVSEKTKAAKRQMVNQGKFVGSHAPYGYKKHGTIGNKLIIDEKSSAIVRRIFEGALEGKSTSQIADILNSDGVLTPGQYYRQHNEGDNKFSFMSEQISWDRGMVYRILTNRRYTGALVSGAKRKVSLGSKKYVRQVPVIVEGAFGAVVTQAEFYRAQSVIRTSKKFSVCLAQGDTVELAQMAVEVQPDVQPDVEPDVEP